MPACRRLARILKRWRRSLRVSCNYDCLRLGALLMATLLAGAIACSQIKTEVMGPVAEFHSPAETYVSNSRANGATRTSARGATAVARVTAHIPHTLERRTTVWNLIVYYLAFGMVFAEVCRGIREVLEHRRRSRSSTKTDPDGQVVNPLGRWWRRWATVAMAAVPALMAVLYYGTHTMMT
jgi:hypothetical protein